MGWLGLGKEAKGIGEGVSTVTQGIRHLITGDMPPEVVIELQKADMELVKIHAQIVEADNKAGGFNKILRPAIFAITFLAWLTLVMVKAFGGVDTGVEFALKEVSALLFLLVPSFFIYRTYEKIKGVVR